MLTRIYLRASAADQCAGRAKEDLLTFARERGLQVAKVYEENASGATLDRPKLRELLDDCQANEVLLLESVDRLSRLSDADWQLLRAEIKSKAVKVVALDLPVSWIAAGNGNGDEFTARLFGALNDMLLDVLSAVARKDYEQRRFRVAQGIAKAKKAGDRYNGRPEDTARNSAIADMLARGMSWSQVMTATKCSRATVAKVAGRVRQAAEAA